MRATSTATKSAVASRRRALAAAPVSILATLALNSPGHAQELGSASSPMQVAATVVRPLDIQQSEDAQGYTTLQFSGLGDANVTTNVPSIPGTASNSITLPPVPEGQTVFVTIEY